MPANVFAHSVPGRPIEEGEPLSHHLAAVGDRSAAFAEAFGWAEVGRVAGRLHDIGKCSAPFQAYIRGERERGGDHSSAGARVAAATYTGLHSVMMGRLLSFAIAGHHAGLADGIALRERLQAAPADAPGWQTHTEPLPGIAGLVPTRPLRRSEDGGFSEAFLIRMVFSCLVDADFLETERFYAQARNDPVERGNHRDLAELRDRLRDHMAQKRATTTELNRLRAEVLDHAIAKADLAPGAFTLTVPTGGGKTLASLSFALDHALRHRLRRIVYVVPFTSIIEQTAAVFREALKTEDDILEHHANFDWEKIAERRTDDEEGCDGLVKLRRAAENWDVPIVVTTAVQFFESLFARRTARCRKLHNLAGSVVILDEAQTLPIKLLRPCVAALKELSLNYSVSVVLCTATQPALRAKDGFQRGFAIDEARELAPDPEELYARLKRVQVERLDGPTPDEAVAARFAEQPTQQMLCIVNSRAHAFALFEAIRELPGAVHLSTLMCSRHRRIVLAKVRERLQAGQATRVVSTSLIEAGVDISFPEVWRAAAGLDSIAQAAGRCNREGGPVLGRTVVFEPAEAKPPNELRAFWDAARETLRRHHDPLTLDAVQHYFRLLYWAKGSEAFDAATLEGRPWPILPAIKERSSELSFEFEKIAAAFRMIDEVMEPVVVPWRAFPEDDDAGNLLGRIAGMERPRRADLRRLQQYTVPITSHACAVWLAAGVLRPVHQALGDRLLRFDDLAHYDSQTGVQLDPALRAPEANIIS